MEGTLTLPGRGLVRFVLAEVQLGGGGESRMEAKKAKAKAEALAFIRRWGRCAWSTALEGTREHSAEDLACGFQRLPVPEGSRWVGTRAHRIVRGHWSRLDAVRLRQRRCYRRAARAPTPGLGVAPGSRTQFGSRIPNFLLFKKRNVIRYDISGAPLCVLGSSHFSCTPAPFLHPG